MKNKVGANDRVLALDWEEAAVNRSGVNTIFEELNKTANLADVANGRAATWITPVAEFAVRTLQEQYGLDANKTRERLNLVGHSLGTYVSDEIGRIYRDGGTLIDPFPATPETANTDIVGRSEEHTSDSSHLDLSRMPSSA